MKKFVKLGIAFLAAVGFLALPAFAGHCQRCCPVTKAAGVGTRVVVRTPGFLFRTGGRLFTGAATVCDDTVKDAATLGKKCQ